MQGLFLRNPKDAIIDKAILEAVKALDARNRAEYNAYIKAAKKLEEKPKK